MKMKNLLNKHEIYLNRHIYKAKSSNTSQWEKSFLILLHKCLNVASLFQGIIHLPMRKIFPFIIIITFMINIALLALKSLVANILWQILPFLLIYEPY